MDLLKFRRLIYCAILTVLIIIVHPVQAANIFQQEDLAGTWEVNSLASGPGAPWWERGPVTVNADGSFSGTLDQHNGDPDTVSGILNITSDGIITITETDEDFRCTMDMGKTVIACTNTWSTGSPGTTEINVWVKKARSY